MCNVVAFIFYYQLELHTLVTGVIGTTNSDPNLIEERSTSTATVSGTDSLTRLTDVSERSTTTVSGTEPTTYNVLLSSVSDVQMSE